MVVIRKLLLPLSETSCGRSALATGFAVANLWQAKLCALIVQIDSRDVAPLAGDGLSGAMIEDMMQVTEQESADRSARLRALFERARRTLAAVSADGTIEVVRGREEELVPSLARLADLTILPHPDATEGEDASGTLHAVLFESGRPVLIAPRTAPATIGTRCCLAWNGTVESSSALSAALPWLARAQAVRILHAGAYQRRGPSAAEVVPYLALHGITADTSEFEPANRDVGAGLLQAAASFGADFLAMGAYSHSRLRQLILGGVTRHVLSQSTLPVLMCR
jgi:nucleotide-binding universal stress UspA family protein